MLGRGLLEEKLFNIAWSGWSRVPGRHDLPLKSERRIGKSALQPDDLSKLVRRDAITLLSNHPPLPIRNGVADQGDKRPFEFIQICALPFAFGAMPIAGI